jgi:hypothetical protein
LGGVIKRNSAGIQGFASTTYHHVSFKKDLLNGDEFLVGEKRLRPSAVVTVGRFFSRFNDGYLARQMEWLHDIACTHRDCILLLTTLHSLL